MDIHANRHTFLGCSVDACTQKEAVDAVRELTKAPEPSCVMFLNVDVIVKSDSNKKLRELTHRSTLCLMDGKPPLKVAQRCGIPLPEKVSGSDFAPAICEMAAREHFSVFFLGGKEGVPERAAENVRCGYPGIGPVGAHSPKFGFDRTPEGRAAVVSKVKEAAPDVLFVCLGCPKQEEFVYDCMNELGVPCIICAGAVVDFMAGNVRRAPEWVSRMGLEWLYRFCREPRRLFRRYFVDSWHFVTMIRQEKSNIRAAGHGASHKEEL